MFSAAFLLCPHSHQKLGPNPDRSTILVKYCRRTQPGNVLGGLEQKQRDLCAHAASRGRMFSWNLISVSILQEKQLYFWTFGSWNQQPPDINHKNHSGPSKTTTSSPISPTHAPSRAPNLHLYHRWSNIKTHRDIFTELLSIGGIKNSKIHISARRKLEIPSDGEFYGWEGRSLIKLVFLIHKALTHNL